MKRLSNAFTLTELLVALGVIAVLCAILLPVIFNMMPNQNTIMAKRAYYTVQSVVSDLINNESCYPDKTLAVENPRVGFDDAAGYTNCAAWGQDHAKDSTMEKAREKFVKLFTDELGVNADAKSRFTTSDGMDWSFTGDGQPEFSSSDKQGGSVLLTVDVNGGDKPNCGQAFAYVSELGTSGDACNTRTNGYDRFAMRIYGNGKIEILSGDKWAQEAIKVNRNITSDKNSNAED